MPTLDAILLAARQKTVELYTSTLTITEVAYATTDDGKKVLTPEIEGNIDALILGGLVRIIEINRYTSIEARRIIRDSITTSPPVIKPPDALHLAAALQVGLTEFQTYDQKLVGHQGLRNLTIREPVALQPLLPEDGSASP